MSERKYIEDFAGTCDGEETELLGQLVAEYSEEINRLRSALRWVFDHSSDPRAADRALQALVGGRV